MFRKPAAVLVGAFLYAVCTLGAPGQSEKLAKANVSGKIVDPTGMRVPGAHVWIHEQGDRRSFNVTADESGRFSISLPLGYYYVIAGSPGFAPHCESIWVKAQGAPLALKIRLGADTKNLQD